MHFGKILEIVVRIFSLVNIYEFAHYEPIEAIFALFKPK